MSIYKRIESKLNEQPTKTKVYLSSIILLIVMIYLKDILTYDETLIISFLVVVPIVAYYLTFLILRK